MPTYDYKCKECKNIQEEVHTYKKVTNDENDFNVTLVCKNCGKIGTMFRKISAEFAEFSASDPEIQKKKLKKRSRDHYKKQIREKAGYLNRRDIMP